MSILQGRSAIVTGAATGIGRSIALCLAQHGARLVIGDIQAADETVRLAAESGPRADFVPCDVTDETAIRNFVEQAIRLCDGRIDILVNSAGINGECQLIDYVATTVGEDASSQPHRHDARRSRGHSDHDQAWCRSDSQRGSQCGTRGLPFRSDYVCSKWAV